MDIPQMKPSEINIPTVTIPIDRYDNFVKNEFLLINIVTGILDNAELNADGTELKMCNDDIIKIIKHFASVPYKAKLKELKEVKDGHKDN